MFWSHGARSAGDFSDGPGTKGRSQRRHFGQPHCASTPKSGARAGFDGHKKRKGSKGHIAVDTLGHLLALAVTPANEQDRAQVGQLAEAVQAEVTEPVKVAFVDQGYTGDQPASAAEQGIELLVVKHHEAKRGFVLLPRRWVVDAPLPGPPGSADWRATTKGWPPPSPAITGSLL